MLQALRRAPMVLSASGSHSACHAPCLALAHLSRRLLHASAASLARYGDSDVESGAGSEGGEDGDDEQAAATERVGRPFLDPRLPRRQESVRSNPKYAKWGGTIDILEHAIYCNAQREEDQDGFFFDQTTPAYDSDCDGDPFSNGYLTEDEMEFPEEYEPAPYIPNRICDQIYFLYTARGFNIKALCIKFRLSSERVCAIIQIKHREPEMLATGRVNPEMDRLMLMLYGDQHAEHDKAAKAAKAADSTGTGATIEPEPSGYRVQGPVENWHADFDRGVQFTLLHDDQMPDDVMPIRRTVGNVLRQRHPLRKIRPPARAARAHDSKFVVKNISGRVQDKIRPRGPLIISDFDGSVRAATNTESLYRSWETRHWTLEDVKGPGGLPFKDEDANKPADYRLAP